MHITCNWCSGEDIIGSEHTYGPKERLLAKKQDPGDIYKRNNNQYETSPALQSQRREHEY